MRIPWPFRRNRRWVRQVDAYVDDRLTPVERELFEERVAESDDVRQALDDTWALKQRLRQMPQHPAPRSFQLTPEMVEKPALRPVPRGSIVTLRLAQGTAAAALAAFAVTGAIHLGTAGGEDPATGPQPGADLAEDSADAPAEDAEPGAGPMAESAADDESRAADADGAEEQPAAETADTGTDNGVFLPIYASLGAVFALALGAWVLTRRQIRGTWR